MMKVKKELKNIDRAMYPRNIFFMDDLTRTRAKLAYKARLLKRREKITDTWVWESKVLVKDLHDNIRQINSAKDLLRYDSTINNTD